MTIHAREQALYSDVYSSVEAYSQFSPGEHYVPMFLDHVGPRDPRQCTVLDAGCGTGKGGVALSKLGFDVVLCDFTADGLVPEAQALPFRQACLWHDLHMAVRGMGHSGRTRVDFVYCCDVLEHIPPQFTMLVVDQLLRVATHGVFLSISLVPDHFGTWVGTPLHQTVQPFIWWKESLGELGTVRDARDLLNNAIFFVEPT